MGIKEIKDLSIDRKKYSDLAHSKLLEERHLLKKHLEESFIEFIELDAVLCDNSFIYTAKFNLKGTSDHFLSRAVRIKELLNDFKEETDILMLTQFFVKDGKYRIEVYKEELVENDRT